MPKSDRQKAYDEIVKRAARVTEGCRKFLMQYGPELSNTIQKDNLLGELSRFRNYCDKVFPDLAIKDYL